MAKDNTRKPRPSEMAMAAAMRTMREGTKVASYLEDASRTLNQARLQWLNGRKASEVLDQVEEVKAHLEQAISQLHARATD